jgi:hypothetical protein
MGRLWPIIEIAHSVGMNGLALKGWDRKSRSEHECITASLSVVLCMQRPCAEPTLSLLEVSSQSFLNIFAVEKYRHNPQPNLKTADLIRT